MIQKAFLNKNITDSTSCILTHLYIKDSLISYTIRITGWDSLITLYSTKNDENDLYKLNTLVEHITNLRDRFLFWKENKKKIENRYKTKEEAQQFLDYLKEKDNLLFEKYVVKTFGNKKETFYRIVCKENVEDFEY